MSKNKQKCFHLWGRINLDLFGNAAILDLMDKGGAAAVGAYFYLMLEIKRRDKERIKKDEARRIKINRYKYTEKLLDYENLFFKDSDGYYYPLVGLRPEDYMENRQRAEAYRLSKDSSSTSHSLSLTSPDSLSSTSLHAQSSISPYTPSPTSSEKLSRTTPSSSLLAMYEQASAPSAPMAVSPSAPSVGCSSDWAVGNGSAYVAEDASRCPSRNPSVIASKCDAEYASQYDAEGKMRLQHARTRREEEIREEKSIKNTIISNDTITPVSSSRRAVNSSSFSWQEVVLNIPHDCEWALSVLGKHKQGEQFARHWPTVKEFFIQHVTAQSKGRELHSDDEVRRYLANFLANQHTVQALLDYIAREERSAPVLYQFEDQGSCPGHRRFGGVPIPDDAPPRPNGLAQWCSQDNCWID